MKRFFDDAIEATRESGYAFTVLGRRRFLGDIAAQGFKDRSHAERQASNMPIQGSAADVCKCAMLLCDSAKLDYEYGWHMLMQVHDEVILEGPQDSADAALAEVRRAMQNPFNGKNLLRVDLDVSAGCAVSWFDAK